MESLIEETAPNDPVSTLPGIASGKAALLAKSGIFTLRDLLTFYPRDYKDTVHFFSFAEIAQCGHAAAGVATVTAHERVAVRGGILSIIIAADETGALCEFPLFNRGFLLPSFPVGKKFYFYSKIMVRTGRFRGNLTDFESYSENPAFFRQWQPVYPLTAGLSQAFFIKAVRAALERSRDRLSFRLPPNWQSPFSLLSYAEALRCIHLPKTETEIEKARRTLGYFELYRFAAAAKEHRLNRARVVRKTVSDSAVSPLQQKLIESLPFALTAGQQTALTEINRDLNAPVAMERLLQGDVGCGKTLVAFLAAAGVIERGQQCALMVPTELLARQHAEKAFRLFTPVGITVSFFTGSLNKDSRQNVLQMLRKGEIDLIIGTHALFSQDVAFADLGLVIIDEQHKFGVIQRSSLFAKGEQPDILMMSATPIPGTLARTVYASLEVSTIEDLPRGRLPIQTHLARTGNEQKVYNFVHRELTAGHQAYFVYPLIEENSRSDLKDSHQMAEALQMQVFPDFRVALIHSRLTEEQKLTVMERFSAGDIDILVSTTVVEVGIDNPNATVMVIENAQRFGLATLHQLRGRIGRSSLPSYCFLIYDNENLTEEGKSRLKILARSNNGFEIAGEDLKLRGPGEIFGERQTGMLKFKIADPVAESKILEHITDRLNRLYPDKTSRINQ